MRYFKQSLIIFLLVIAGCIPVKNFKSVKPIFPEVGNPNFPKTIDSLQPTFEWETSAKRTTAAARLESIQPGSQWETSTAYDVTYDFIIYECIKKDECIKTVDPWGGKRRAEGREIYHRQGLKESKHTIEEPLKPDTGYFWSVRIRQGQKVSDWAVYDYTIYSSGGSSTAHNYPFIFKTPKN